MMVSVEGLMIPRASNRAMPGWTNNALKVNLMHLHMKANMFVSSLECDSNLLNGDSSVIPGLGYLV
jgi:hypothetical protein